jgi:hypothetical protein
MTKEMIDKNLDDLAKVTQIIRKFRDTGIMPDIEKDIVIAKLQSIYECIQEVKSERILAHDVIATAPKSEKPEAIITEVTPSKKEETSDKKETKEAPVPVKEIPAPTKEASVPVKETNNSEQKYKEVIKSKRQNPKIGSKQEIKTEILADQFQQTFLNEALAQFNNRLDISKKLQSRPLKDISTAIGLNEKYLFIKELFNDNAALYQNTIDKLNNFANFNEAIQFIDDYFEWDFDAEQVQKLLELVHRRFLTD